MRIVKVPKALALIAAMLAVMALAAVVACGSTEPAEIDEDQLSRIVSQAVAEAQPAPQPQVSAADIQKMVDSAMMGVAEGQVSADQIQSMVQQAVSGAAQEGASAEEIQKMVESAVMAATADSVTSADVQSAISMAVMEAQEGAVTAKDVEAAMMAAQAGAVTSEEVQAAVQKAADSAAMQVAENSLTAEEIESIVSKAFEERAMMEQAPRETIMFSDLNWPSAQVQNRIIQYIAEKGYGYPTDVTLGSTLTNFPGFLRGDIHVTMEVWLPNQDAAWKKAVDVGDVVAMGTSLVGDWQSYFVVPQYIADAYPDLKTPQDLKKPEFQELFATADSRGKARLVGCLVDWSCSQVGDQQLETYGLADYIHLVTPGSTAALNADIRGAYEKQEPWLGYQWGTNAPAIELDLVRLQEEPWSQECWDADKGCAFADSVVIVAVHKSLLPRAPEIVSLLQAWEFSVPTFKEISNWLAEDDTREPADAAIWFLKNKDVWENWVTPEAAAAVNAALANEG